MEPIVPQQSYSAFVEKQNSELSKWQLDSSQIINETLHTLKGDYYDEDKDEWVHFAGTKALLNEVGIREVLTLIRSVNNKITFLSDLDERQIYDITRQLHITLNNLLFLKQHEFQLDIKSYNLIIQNIINPIFIGLMRSLKGGEREFQKSTKRTIESVIHTPDEHTGFRLFGGRKQQQ